MEQMQCTGEHDRVGTDRLHAPACRHQFSKLVGDNGEGATDVWLFEVGLRAQLTRSVIGELGLGVGLNGGLATPTFTITAGVQIGF
jgi:hypothetical protein